MSAARSVGASIHRATRTAVMASMANRFAVDLAPCMLPADTVQVCVDGGN